MQWPQTRRPSETADGVHSRWPSQTVLLAKETVLYPEGESGRQHVIECTTRVNWDSAILVCCVCKFGSSAFCVLVRSDVMFLAPKLTYAWLVLVPPLYMKDKRCSQGCCWQHFYDQRRTSHRMKTTQEKIGQRWETVNLVDSHRRSGSSLFEVLPNCWVFFFPFN